MWRLWPSFACFRQCLILGRPIQSNDIPGGHQLKKEEINKTGGPSAWRSTRRGTSSQRLEPDGGQGCGVNHRLRCLAGKQGLWVSCTKYCVARVCGLVMGNQRSSPRKGPGKAVYHVLGGQSWEFGSVGASSSSTGASSYGWIDH